MDKIPLKVYCPSCQQIRWITAYPDQYKYADSNTFPVSICLDCKEGILERLKDLFNDK